MIYNCGRSVFECKSTIFFTHAQVLRYVLRHKSTYISKKSGIFAVEIKKSTYKIVPFTFYFPFLHPSGVGGEVYLVGPESGLGIERSAEAVWIIDN